MKNFPMSFISFLMMAFVFSKCSNQPSKQESQVTTKDSATESSNATNVAKNWKLGVQMWTFRMFSFTDALNKLDSAGIKNIEAFFGQPLGGNMKGNFGTEMSA